MKKINLWYIVILLIFHSCSLSNKKKAAGNSERAFTFSVKKSKTWGNLTKFKESGDKDLIRIYEDSIVVFFQNVDTAICSNVYIDSVSLQGLRKIECYYNNDSLNLLKRDFYDYQGRATGLWVKWHSNGQLESVFEMQNGQNAQGARYRYDREGKLRQFINTSVLGKFPMTELYWDKQNRIIFYQEINDKATANGYGYLYEKDENMSYFVNTSIDSFWSKPGYVPIDSLDWLSIEDSEPPVMVYPENSLKSIDYLNVW